jgi:hypothetical protein
VLSGHKAHAHHAAYGINEALQGVEFGLFQAQPSATLPEAVHHHEAAATRGEVQRAEGAIPPVDRMFSRFCIGK